MNTNHPSDTTSQRLFPIDALRGSIMALMALDHANWFVAQKHPPSEMWGGPYPAYNDALSFLVRFVTHLAAPGFFLLMGAGMILLARSRARGGWSRWSVIRHLWLRGGVLIALQFLVVNRAWELSIQGWELRVYIGVLGALGGAMILGSLMLWLRPPYLALLAAGLFVGTEFLHPDSAQWGKLAIDLPNLLLVRPGGDLGLWSNYPALPWVELVVFGMLFTHWLLLDPSKAYRRAWQLGVVMLAAFVILRGLDGFGNIRPRTGDNWIDYLNPVKYPPSMTFTLLTTGVNLILLWLFSRTGVAARHLLQPLVVLGQAPLFSTCCTSFSTPGWRTCLPPMGRASR